MAKMSLLSVVSKGLLATLTQSRLLVTSVSVGIYLRAIAFLDSLGLVDSASVDFGKASNDGLSASESLANSTDSPKSDGFQASDSPVKTPIKALADSSSFSDATTFEVGKGILELPVFTDAASLDITSVLSDQVFATDDLEGEASIDDEQNISFFSAKADSAFALDALVLFVSGSRSDIIASTDAGLLLNQDYVDNPFYFADDYVGIKRTF